MSLSSIRPGNDDLEISDTESGSSYAGTGSPDKPACSYQNSEFFGRECSRYHDCPTHIMERSTADDNRSEGSDQSEQHEAVSMQLNGTMEDGTTTENSSTESSREDAPLPGQVSASGSERSHVNTNGSSSEDTSLPSPPAIPPTDQESAPQEQPEGITLREALNQTAESLGDLSIRDGAQSLPEAATSQPPPIDTRQNLTTSSTSRPASSLNPIAPSFVPRPESSPQEISLSRWQPDSEVTYCPICHTQFSFFVRKHHCRKCGRVVCNSCSPHRITIPHQYIVRPPWERAYQRYSFLGDEGSIAEFSALGGGEQVRLCDSCTTPTQIHHPSQFQPRPTHQRSQSGSDGNYSGNYNGDGNLPRYHPYLVPPNPSSDAYPRSRSVTMNSGQGHARPTNSTYLPPQSRIITGTPPAYYPQPYSGYRHPSLLGPRFPGASLIDLAGPSSSSSSAVMNRPLPPPPQIPEEDECPICHRELPSRDLPNFETRRESHINSCIIAHSTYSQGADASDSSGNRGTPPRIARRTGMFPYLATEKDCVDSAECTICLEEFEAGVPMARLECLCRFHRSCITAWFRDHPGRCPVHQHDSFGY
ncbi:FYVE-domain-containing protein [Hypoxylon sp. NC1633]|nr:FYVE-domain-containing protein [Hypoxylon sp. NC1633]